MNYYTFDSMNEALLLSKNDKQVMMEWEKPYMEHCIDILYPVGNVLEIGFGLGYSADRIQFHKPKSHTIIECDPIVLTKLEIWARDKPNVKIVRGRWQETMHSLGIFDEIFMDDYPLEISKDSSNFEKILSQKRFQIFIDLCIQNHTRVGSRISGYLNSNKPLILGSDSAPFCHVISKFMDVKIPETCQYRNIKEQQCQIPLIIKTKKFNFQLVSYYALKEIKKSII